MNAKQKVPAHSSFVCVDPGVKGTGLAYWESSDSASPQKTRLVQIRGGKQEWLQRAMKVTRKTGIFLRETLASHVFIEGQEIWHSSPKSYASSGRGDIIKLCQLAGMLIWCARTTNILCDVELVPVRQWKGQLTKFAVSQRVKKITGKNYGDHVDDAVGIGLYLMGKL